MCQLILGPPSILVAMFASLDLTPSTRAERTALVPCVSYRQLLCNPFHDLPLSALITGVPNPQSTCPRFLYLLGSQYLCSTLFIKLVKEHNCFFFFFTNHDEIK